MFDWELNFIVCFDIQVQTYASNLCLITEDNN
jgi:hypothetical protein